MIKILSVLFFSSEPSGGNVFIFIFYHVWGPSLSTKNLHPSKTAHLVHIPFVHFPREPFLECLDVQASVAGAVCWAPVEFEGACVPSLLVEMSDVTVTGELIAWSIFFHTGQQL